MRGYPLGPSLHMGKILECAAIAAVPGSGSDCMFATLDETGFVVETLADERACTVTSVAAHTLYEKVRPLPPSRPWRQPRPVKDRIRTDRPAPGTGNGNRFLAGR